MRFREGAVAEFLKVFYESGDLIRGFEGCHYLELLHDINDPQTYFTISLWESESALQGYRRSDLFQSTWALTKPLFAEKAVAWSTHSEVLLK